MSEFSRTLTRLRREAGFATAYAFYHRNGGRRVFPFTFAYYVKLERGQHLPRPEWLSVLLDLLRIPSTSAVQHRFVVSFLRALFATEGDFQTLLAPLLRKPVPEKLGQKTAKRLASEQACRLTPEQYKAVIADAASFWVFACLVNDRGAWSVEDLAAKLELPAPQVEAGLRGLASERLVSKDAGGGYRSPLAMKPYAFPRSYPGVERDRQRSAKHIAEMIARRGAVLQESGIMLRAEEADVRRALTAMREAMEASATPSVCDGTEGHSLFILQLRARRTLVF